MSEPHTKLDFIVGESEKAFLTEAERTEKLTGKAEKLISAVAVVMGFQLIDFKTLAFTRTCRGIFYACLALSALSTLGISLIIALWAMRVEHYQSYARNREIYDLLEPQNVTDEQARDAMARMYLDARENNALINDQRAASLSDGTILLVTGIFLVALSTVVDKFPR